ncbi:MAG: hypothetical protein ABIP90_04015, partial [Vicinamibacterales bacterium]
LFWLLTEETHPRDAASAGVALRERRPRIARRLRAMVAKCLAQSPTDRYPDAAGVVADLARYRAGEAVSALPETIVDRGIRFTARHATIIVLVAAYLVMRTLVAWLR